jgi:hypothetical protein
MAKRNPYVDQMMVGIRKEIDEDALTTVELANGAGVSSSRMSVKISERVTSGDWERVWKMGKTRLVPAYRPAKK